MKKKNKQFLHNAGIKQKKLIKAFWDTGKEECINKYIKLDPSLIIHLISLSIMADNKKAGRQPPWEKTSTKW